MTWELLPDLEQQPKAEPRSAFNLPTPSAEAPPPGIYGPFIKGQDLTQGAKELGKTGLVGIEALLAGVGGIPGAAIETPSALTQLAYEVAGRKAPEWTQGPAPFRLDQSGEPFIKTPEELLEAGGISGHGKPQGAFQEYIAPRLSMLSSLLAVGVNPIAALSMVGASDLIRSGAQELGIQGPTPAVAELLTNLGIGGVAAGRGTAQQFASAEGKALAQTAQVEGVTAAPAAIQAAGRRGGSAFLRSIGRAGEKVQERARLFRDQIENAYRDVLGDIFTPYKTERNLKVLKEQTGKLFEPVESIAANTTQRIPVSGLIKTIDDQIGVLKKSKAPSDSERAALQYLENTKSNLLKNTDPAIKNIESEISRLKQIKEPTASEQAQIKNLEAGRDRLLRNPTIDHQEATRTFRSFNDQVSWDSPTRGSSEIIKAKEGLRNDIRAHGNREYVEAFDISNAAWTELNRLGEAADILKTATNADGSFNLQGFHKAVKNPENKTLLERSLGPELYERLSKISDLAEEGRKNFAKVGAYLPEDQQALHQFLGAQSGMMPAPATGAIEQTMNFLYRNFAARVLTNPNLQTNYIGYLGALKRESPKLAAYYMTRIQKELEPEQQNNQSGWELVD